MKKEHSDYSPSRRVDLNLFNVFIAVMHEQNLSRAGELIGLSQSAVSQALGRLRQVYNDPLFIRQSGEMLPTPFANKIYPQIKDAVANIHQSLPQKKLQLSALDITFKINVSYLYFESYMQRFVGSVSKQAPDVAIHVSTLALEHPHKALQANETDIYLDYFPVEHPSCHFETLFWAEVMVVARKDHPRFKGKNSISMAEYMKEYHAVFMPKGRDRYPLDVANKFQLEERKVRFVSTTMEHLMSICAVTDYLCVMPKTLIDFYPDKDQFVLLAPPFETTQMPVYMNWHALMENIPGHKWLRTELKSAFAAESLR